ncbi:MAG: helix-turn-helix domain-containing protein [Pseudonocardiaceae bacterium]
MTEPWPWPRDTALARARRVAHTYRAVLADTDPTACRDLDNSMLRYGQQWIAPRIATHAPGDYLTATDVADYVGVNAKTVYEWRARGLASIRTPEGIRFRYTDVQAWVAGRRHD